MASPYTITNVTDVAAGGTSSLIQGDSGRTLNAASRVQIYANREGADVTFTITIGSQRIGLRLASSINTTAGDIPTIPDDALADTFGAQGDEIVIEADNANAAAQEARVLIRITEIDDNALAMAMQTLGQVSGIGFA